MSLSFENTQIAFQYRNNKELKLAHFLFFSMRSALLTRTGMAIAKYTMKWNLPFDGIIKNTIFKQFCGGETIEEAAQTAALLKRFNVDVALDYGAEANEKESDFDQAVNEFVKAINYAGTQSNVPFIALKITGFAKFELLEKIHNKEILNKEDKQAWAKVLERLHAICSVAKKQKVMILIDAEQSWIQDPVDDLTDLMMEHYNQESTVVSNTFQMYRHDRLEFLKKSLEKAKERNYLLGAKLVRGAYMEKERARAKQLNYPSPIQPDKESTDRDFDIAVDFCLQNHEHITVFFGTHNEQSCMTAAGLMSQYNLKTDDKRIYFSQLFGMSDNITFNLSDAGYNTLKYLPYGPVKDVIPYLIRRAQENSSISGQTGRELSLIQKEMKRRGL